MTKREQLRNKQERASDKEGEGERERGNGEGEVEERDREKRGDREIESSRNKQ